MRTEMNKPAGSLGTKRLLAAIAVLAVALAVFAAVPAVADDSDAADGKTYYVDANTSATTSDGTESAPFKTITEALAKNDDSKIVLKNDITELVHIADGQNVALDLNGFTLQNPSDKNDESQKGVILNDGTLTIMDSSKNGNGTVNAVNRMVAIANTGTLTIDGGNFTNTATTDKNPYANYILNNNGMTTINGGKFVMDSTNMTNSSIVKNGWYDSNAATVVSNDVIAHVEGKIAKMTINDGSFTSWTFVKNDKYGDMTIAGGTFTLTEEPGTTTAGACVSNSSSLKITGGTFDHTASKCPLGIIWIYYGTMTEITGGTFKISDNFKGNKTASPLVYISLSPNDNNLIISEDVAHSVADHPVLITDCAIGTDVTVGDSSVNIIKSDTFKSTFTYDDGELVIDMITTGKGNSYVSGDVRIETLIVGDQSTVVLGNGSEATLLNSSMADQVVSAGGVLKDKDGKTIEAGKIAVDGIKTVKELNEALAAGADVGDANVTLEADDVITVSGSSLSGTIKFGNDEVKFENVKGDFKVYGGSSIDIDASKIEGTITDMDGAVQISGKITGDLTINSGTVAGKTIKFADVTVNSGVTLTLKGAGTFTVVAEKSFNLYGSLATEGVTAPSTISVIVPEKASFKAYSGSQIAGTILVTGTGKIDLSQAQNPQTVSEDISHDKTYGQLENVTVVDSLTIRNNSKVTIMGQFNIDEGVTLTIEEGSQLIIEGTALVKIEGNLVIEENATVTQNGGKVSVYGNAEIAGEYSINVKGVSIVAEQDSVITIEETGKLSLHWDNSGAMIVKDSARLKVEGTVTNCIANYGTVEFDSQVPAHIDVAVRLMNEGATAIITNYVLGLNEVNNKNCYLSITDDERLVDSDGKFLAYTGITSSPDENSVRMWSNSKLENGDVVSISGLTFTGRVISEPSDNPSANGYYKGKVYEKRLEMSGNLSSVCSDKDGNAKDGELQMELRARQGIVIPENEAFTIGSNVKVINYVDYQNHTDFTLYVEGAVDATAENVKFANWGIIDVTGSGAIKTLDRITTGTVNAVMFETKNGTETVYNYTTLKTAVDSGAKDITVLGTVKVDESISIPKDTTVKGDGTIVIGSSENTDVELVFADGAVAKTVKFDVDGTLYFENKKDNKASDIQSDVSVIGEKDARYTNVYTALAKANAGDTVTVSGDTVNLKKNIIIKEGVTLNVPYEKHLKVYSGVTVTVNGTLRTIEEIGTEQYTDNGETKNVKFDLSADKLQHKAAIVVNGVFMSGVQFSYGDNEKSLPVYRIPGAYYYQVDSVGEFYYATTLENASKNAAADVKDIEIYGKVAAGDVTFTGTDSLSKDITVTDGAELTVASITLDKATLNVEGMITGDIKAGESAVTVKNVKTEIYVDKDGVYTVESVDESKLSSGEEAFFKVSAGSVYIQNADVEVTVLAGATLVSGTEAARIAALTIEGTVAVANGQTIIVDYGVIVMGTLSIAAATDSEAAGTFETPELLVGVDVDDLVETGDAASVSGAIDKVQVAVVKADATVSEATIDSFKDANGVLKSTTYVVEDNDWIVVYDKTGEFQIGYIEKAPVENAKFTGKWLNTDGDIANGELVGVSKCEKVTADVEYDIYTIRINVDAGLESIAIDGNLMLKDFETGMYTMDVKAGTHDITCKLANGYSGDAKFSLVKSVASDDGKIDASVSGNKVTVSGDEGTVYVQITGITASGYAPAPVEPVEDKDDGLSLTDILLIILVVLIVVMAIIVALRLMRS